MRIFTVVLGCFCVANINLAQTTDTLYYDRNSKGCDEAFATYYRIYSLPTGDILQAKRYRDYYFTGELKSEGEYISIDKDDDSRSVFDGEFIDYYKSGETERTGAFINGKLEGEYVQYNKDGLIMLHAYYKDGKLDGICTEFSEDGYECIQTEYSKGEPLYDYYTISNSDGYCSKVSLSTEQPVYDTPLLNEKHIVYRDGDAWHYYYKNGIMVGMTADMVSDYGRYFQLSIIIANISMFPIEFEPNNINATLIDKKGYQKVFKVYSSDDYMKKVRQGQNFAIVLTAIAEGMSAAMAGYSTSTTFIGGSVLTTTTYNAAAAYQARVIASDRVAEYSNSLLLDREIKEKGYLKRTTIFPGETIAGYINIDNKSGVTNIERKKGASMVVDIDFGGAIYSFPWEIYGIYNK